MLGSLTLFFGTSEPLWKGESEDVEAFAYGAIVEVLLCFKLIFNVYVCVGVFASSEEPSLTKGGSESLRADPGIFILRRGLYESLRSFKDFLLF